MSNIVKLLRDAANELEKNAAVNAGDWSVVSHTNDKWALKHPKSFYYIYVDKIAMNQNRMLKLAALLNRIDPLGTELDGIN